MENQLKRFTKVIQKGEIGLLEEIEVLHEELDSLKSKINDVKTLAEETQKMEGQAGLDGTDGKDGQDYVLTPADKKEIAKQIKVPVVEKIIEKIEVIKEQPIVTEVINNVENKITTEDIVTKLLEIKEPWFDWSLIKGTEKIINQEILDRAVSILDQRTSFLINKLSNLQNQVNNTPASTGGGVNIETPSGTIDGANTSFTVTHTPKYLIGDGIAKYENDAYTLSGLTIAWTDGSPPTQSLRSIY